MAASIKTPELRKDPVNNRWVIFSPARSLRPSDLKSKSNPNPNPNPNSKCPFCSGHEHECAPEIFRSPPNSTSDWKIRVIQNLYPALNRSINPTPLQSSSVANSGWVAFSGFGFHDVVIESPVHSVHLPDLSKDEIGDVLLAYKQRIEQLCCFDSIKYVQVFKNHGASAGASMSHSHSQIIALPIIPPSVSNRLNNMKQHYDQTGKCSICESRRAENLIIDESNFFFSMAPFASTSPFEIWIVPCAHSSHFHHLDTDMAVDLGGLLKLTLKKLSSQLNHPPYNMMIHSCPFDGNEFDKSYNNSYEHWYIQIVPQLSIVGGFEMGSGCYINPVFPEDAAKILKQL